MTCCIVGMRIGLLAFILPFVCPFFLSFKAKFVSQFSPELCTLESSNMVYLCRMRDYIVGLRLRIMALIFLFYSIFLSFPILHVNIKIYVGVFSGIFKARMLKFGIHMDNELLYYGIENRTLCSYSSLYLSIFICLSSFLYLDC